MIRFRNEIQQAPGNSARKHCHTVPRVALVTNIPAPYRVKVYNRIAADGRGSCKTRLMSRIYFTFRDVRRGWAQPLLA